MFSTLGGFEMKLDASSLLRGICVPGSWKRGQRMARELGRLMSNRGISLTPLVVTRLEEFLVLYHVVQGIEDRIRDEGLFGVADGESEKVVRGGLHPDLDQALKCRDRLNKCIKEIEGMAGVAGGSEPKSLAELVAGLRDKRKSKERKDEDYTGGKASDGATTGSG